jgi:hypothetical protein
MRRVYNYLSINFYFKQIMTTSLVNNNTQLQTLRDFNMSREGRSKERGSYQTHSDFDASKARGRYIEAPPKPGQRVGGGYQGGNYGGQG